MYYLFLYKTAELNKYRKELDEVMHRIELGKTPVCNERRMAKTMLIEAVPYQTLAGIFLIFGTCLLNNITVNETYKIAFVLIINNLCCSLANYLFVSIKHFLRLRLCKRLKLEATNNVIAAMESLEYQSV